jgi:hypothetical protein
MTAALPVKGFPGAEAQATGRRGASRVGVSVTCLGPRKALGFDWLKA